MTKPDSQRDTQNEEKSENVTDQPASELLQRWKQGDQEAANCLVDRYAFRLIALVASKMNRRFQDNVTPEDIVQSALGSFFVAARDSRIHISQSISLWRLLATFAKRKMMRSIERQSATKRGGDRQRSSMDSLQLLWTEDPTHEHSITIAELLAGLNEDLPTDLQSMLDHVLAGKTNQEIANELGIATRTVRRRMVRLQETLLPNDAQRQLDNQNVTFHSESLPQVGYHEFVLGRMIGAGGFAKVYRASMQTEPPTTVVIKFLRKAFWQDVEAKHSFLREIEQAAKIEHPSVVRYLGWGESPQGGPYVVMESIQGQPLVEREQISTIEFIGILRAICLAMQAVHQAGVIHGDLTPANILLDEANHISIIDFGFSQSKLDDSNRSNVHPDQPHSLGGTLGFAAPEQISNSFGRLGFATDIYAIGGLAFWHLTGSPPHAGINLGDSLNNTIASTEPEIDSLNTNTPELKLIKKIAKLALRKPVALRPATIAELLQILNAAS